MFPPLSALLLSDSVMPRLQEVNVSKRQFQSMKDFPIQAQQARSGLELRSLRVTVPPGHCRTCLARDAAREKLGGALPTSSTPMSRPQRSRRPGSSHRRRKAVRSFHKGSEEARI